MLWGFCVPGFNFTIQAQLPEVSATSEERQFRKSKHTTVAVSLLKDRFGKEFSTKAQSSVRQSRTNDSTRPVFLTQGTAWLHAVDKMNAAGMHANRMRSEGDPAYSGHSIALPDDEVPATALNTQTQSVALFHRKRQTLPTAQCAQPIRIDHSKQRYFVLIIF